MSIESVLSRIAQIQGGTAPPAVSATPAAPAAVAAPGATTSSPSFADQLQSAAGTGSAGATPGAPAAPGTYPHLSGDLDCSPELLTRLEALAEKRGQHFTITSGGRSYAEQLRLWNQRGSNPYPVARPGTSRHESGRAADVTIGGQAIQTVIPAAELRAAGLAPLAGDAVHVELP
ncbi:MAG: D-alanyl-D-alanine carboxypeptidase [Thermoleophilaceae bacterium]|nr:D-alanyl-D-alanine carboxypeptidase [Thermoleophilaceae bacterium]